MSENSTLSASTLDVGALLEFSRILNACNDPSVIYNNVLLSLMGKLGLGRAAVALPNRDGGFFWHEDRLHGAFTLDQIEDETNRDRFAAERIEQILPICSAKETFAILLLGAPMVEKSVEGNPYALLVGTIAAMALEGCKGRGSLLEANRRLERRIHRLRSLFEAGAEF
ncbi:MAG: hypothetical protein ABI876_09200, partial [Bacteroidota bacterium]